MGAPDAARAGEFAGEAAQIGVGLAHPGLQQFERQRGFGNHGIAHREPGDFTDAEVRVGGEGAGIGEALSQRFFCIQPAAHRRPLAQNVAGLRGQCLTPAGIVGDDPVQCPRGRPVPLHGFECRQKGDGGKDLRVCRVEVDAHGCRRQQSGEVGGDIFDQIDGVDLATIDGRQRFRRDLGNTAGAFARGGDHGGSKGRSWIRWREILLAAPAGMRRRQVLRVVTLRLQVQC